MKKILFLSAILALSSLAYSYQVERNLTLPADGILKLSVDAGAGSLKIDGVEGLSSIEVRAEIIVHGVRERRIDAFLNDHLQLSLKKEGEEAVLNGFFKLNHLHFFFGEAVVNLTVRMPKKMELYVDDGSGWLSVDNIQGQVTIVDGSGELTAANIVGNLDVEDGSGSIEVRNVTGDVKIDDGSGSMTIVHVGGSVTVDDGSGSITIDDVAKDVILESTGSGDVDTSNIRGRIIH